MTSLAPDRVRSTFDLPLEAATDRIAGLYRETDRARHADSSRLGLVDGTRARIGRMFITIGSAIAPRSMSATTPASRPVGRQSLRPPRSIGTPPLTTLAGRRSTSMSTSGSASTATRSA